MESPSTSPEGGLLDRRISRRSALRSAALGSVALGAGGIGAVALATNAQAEIVLPTLSATATDADRKLLGFLTSLELAAATAYGLVPATKLVSAANLATLAVFGDHHTQHAAGYTGFAGADSVTAPNATLLKEMTSAINEAKDVRDLFGALSELEDRLAATGSFALSQLEGTDGAKRVASVMNIDARTSVVLAGLAGKATTDYLPTFQSVAEAFAVADYPVE
ncbi:MAG: hypothetical protein AB7V43_22165 [Acidimicrobiia bacterium]